MRIRTVSVLLLAAGLAVTGWARAAARPLVVELFTSEGCSSCPPADQLLESLAHRADVLALSFHVRYWDSLGWPDRFGLEYADLRQNLYAQRLKLPTVFTPQLIIDGQRSFVGSDRRAILAAMHGGDDGVAIAIANEAERLRVELSSRGEATAAEVLLLALLPETETAIGAGENGGRRLREVNVVRAAFVLGRWDGSPRGYALARAALPQDATEVAVLVQQQGQRAILGATQVTLR